MTVNGTSRIRIWAPTGSSEGKRARATVFPRTATLPLPLTSSSSKKVPLAMPQSRMETYTWSTPSVDVIQFPAPPTIWPREATMGETAARRNACSARASRPPG
jgi:hypothetical protein